LDFCTVGIKTTYENYATVVAKLHSKRVEKM
jgi:hypothetical protein